jgi:OOP family OmpA-OmpF porin
VGASTIDATRPGRCPNAATVRDDLAVKGGTSDHIDAEGRGEADPVKTCDDKGRANLIECLASNRRVVVEAEGTH